MKVCDIHSGMLQNRVVIQRMTLTPDGHGGGHQTWALLGNTWAYIIPASGWETLKSMQLETPITHTIYMRYRTDIKARDRIIHRGRVFNIRSIIDIEEEKTFLEIKAEEGVA
jgi:SPP1 family predicted phage head-tail adaptor